jgi:hypothetical protein
VTFTLARESFTPTLLAELKPLILANHMATGSDAPLDPDWLAIEHLNRGDALALVVARFNDKPVGYLAQVMQNHTLYGERWAQCLAIYLAPIHRRHFKELADFAESLAIGGGAAVISYNLPSVRSAQPFVRMGYRMPEVVVTKRLEG